MTTTTTRRRRRSALAATGAIVLAVLALVGVHLAGGSASTAATTTASSAVAHGIQTIPAGVTDAVAAGTGTGPSALTGGTSITAGGKPRVVYIGAEFCPYCAAERWAVVQALSRFGSFTGLGETRSSASDVYPSTASLSFHGATYTSSWLSFSGYETTTTSARAAGTPRSTPYPRMCSSWPPRPVPAARSPSSTSGAPPSSVARPMTLAC